MARRPIVRAAVVAGGLLGAACAVPAIRSGLRLYIGVGLLSLLMGLLILVFRAATIVVHELAHAAAAGLLGWRVRRIVIGYGPLWRRFCAAGVTVDIRLLPIAGCVQPQPTTMKWARLKYTLICLAGPAAESAIVGALIVCLVTDTGPVPIVALLACVGLWGLATSLLPFPYRTSDGTVGNDALLILKAWFQPRSVGITTMTVSDVAKSTKYPVEAFEFVNRALENASNAGPEGAPSHVSGQELCWTLRDHALQSFGAQARQVLASWGVESCEDFGQIVYAMVDAGLIGKTERDSIRDFDGVYAFDQAFAASS